MSAPLETGGTPVPDAAIVAALRTGDMNALGTAYDRYGPALHTYAHSMVRERAADVTHDSFLVAVGRIDQLRDPTRLRPWLYAIVRSECLRVLRHEKRETVFEEWHAESTAEQPDDDLRRREAQALVRAAIGGLSPKDREIVELSLRHDLDNAEIAAVLGVKPSHVTALTSRARKSLEQSLGTLLVARAGGEGCAELTDLLGHWDGEFTPLWRKRIAKHIDNCPVCTGERRRRLSPAAILVVLPLLAVPVALHERVMTDAEPVLVAYRHHAADAAAPPSAAAPPIPAAPPTATVTAIDGVTAWDYPVAATRSRRWLWLCTAAGAALVALLVSTAILVWSSRSAETAPVVESVPVPSITTSATTATSPPAVEAPVEPSVDEPPVTTSAPSSSAPTSSPPSSSPPSSSVPPDTGSATPGGSGLPVPPGPGAPAPDPGQPDPQQPDPQVPGPQPPAPQPQLQLPGQPGVPNSPIPPVF